MLDVCTILKQCEDHLFPSLKMTSRERSLYYHLLRHTRMEGKESALFAIHPLASALDIAESSVRQDIRSLHERGCLRIVERTRLGHMIRVTLPMEIDGLIPEEAQKPPVDVGSMDFYTNRRYVKNLLAREGGRCFYCLKEVDLAKCSLDHVVCQAVATDNSYRNIVASCHDCNAVKGSTPAEDFFRSLYRRGILSQSELDGRFSILEELRAGRYIPSIDSNLT